ncbi:MAG: hypothetical protein IPK10_18280 [Bacteroidetes bacterium]|nr:hypothetical protein [Bacteroidota bacterium]
MEQNDIKGKENLAQLILFTFNILLLTNGKEKLRCDNKSIYIRKSKASDFSEKLKLCIWFLAWTTKPFGTANK